MAESDGGAIASGGAHRPDGGPHDLILLDELDRVEPRGAAVAVAERARADEAGGLAAEVDVPLLALVVHVEVHPLVLPVESQLDKVPPVGHVRRGAVRGAAGAEEAHPAVLGELELRDALVDLVRLAEDEVARVGALVVGAHVEGDALRPEVAVKLRVLRRLAL